jgi:ABC-type sugar transport system ATPase subunit
MASITKHFGGVHALTDVTFSARGGEIHALCGENGAGKSTLMKILAGAITDYEGQIELDGVPVRFSDPRAAEDAGIRIIYQELNLVPELSVAANVFLGRERTGAAGWLDRRSMDQQTGELLARLGTRIDPRARISSLRIGDQQMVEIAKALAGRARVVIMDEPTSALSEAEIERLFRVIRELKAAGTTVIYITHKMNEVFTLADRVTVLRDGRFVTSVERAECKPADVVRWMVGREIREPDQRERMRHEGKPLLEVENLEQAAVRGSGSPRLRGISFRLERGEILGVAGLLGAGRTELLEVLFGAMGGLAQGTIRLEGREIRVENPARAIAQGLALVTEDRKTLGLFDQMTVGQNITLIELARMTRGGLVDRARERKSIEESIRKLGIRTASDRLLITALSGGNQQKCILARWLLTRPKVLLLDEPTRGIDVGAKAEIYHLMRALAGDGMGILMTSSELPELLAVCDRILVLCEGRLTATLPRSEATEERIMDAATQFEDRLSAAGASVPG